MGSFFAKHYKYACYMARHKWYVFNACLSYGLIWQGVVHDWSKFTPLEWIAYTNYFYARNPDGSVPPKTKEAFDYAWLRHQQLNPHHWQWWTIIQDDGSLTPLKIPDHYMKEMLCDWLGAGRATGHPDTLVWYKDNRNKIILHPQTRAWIENELGYKEV